MHCTDLGSFNIKLFKIKGKNINCLGDVKTIMEPLEDLKWTLGYKGLWLGNAVLDNQMKKLRWSLQLHTLNTNNFL